MPVLGVCLVGTCRPHQLILAVMPRIYGPLKIKNVGMTLCQNCRYRKALRGI